MCICVNVCVYIYIHICIYIYAPINPCIYLSMYVYCSGALPEFCFLINLKLSRSRFLEPEVWDEEN